MIERKIIIGLITSTEYLQKIKDIWSIQFIESTAAKRIAAWCWEYYEKYNKAPGKDIESIYFSKIKSPNFPKDIAEDIQEDILPGLSEEYENENPNLPYLIEETQKHFNERHIQIFNANVEALVNEGRAEEAETMVKNFKPLGVTSSKLDEFILTVNQIRRKERSHPTVYMSPWLKGGQTTIIYGNYGTGKSLLTITIAYVLGVSNYDNKECDIGRWQVKNPTGCLYIDGELGELEMEERIKQFEWIGMQPPEHRMRILSAPEYQLATEDTFYLSNRDNQRKVIRWLKEHPTYKLIVLDSASTLFGLEDENSNSEWSTKINPFLRDLRALDVACLLLHHAGKDNKKGLRGASAMGAMAHNIFRLTDYGKDNDLGEAKFVLSIDKQRSAGKSFKSFLAHFFQDEEQRETNWKIDTNFNN